MKLLFLTCALCALLCAAPISAEDMMQDTKVEQTTESPIADMALVDSKDDMMMANMDVKAKKPAEAQPHTIADFIIHPLIALKPRQPEQEPNAVGKQADTSSTTPSPWQLFGFNTGQGLGSSVSSLAGSVTGWLGNRIQLPGLVDTPVRESSSTSTSTTSTTHRPDVVVRVQQRQSTRKPLIINNDFNNRRKNPNRHNNNNNFDNSEEYDDEEYDDDDDDFDNRRHEDNEDDDDFSNEDDDDEESDDDDEEDDEEEDDKPVKQQNNNNNRRRNRPANNNNNNNNNNNRQNNNQRRRVNNNNNNNNNQRNRNQKRRQPQDNNDNDVEQYDDDNDNDGDDQTYYYDQKRSQNQQNFIQRGQQSLMNQIRQFTRGQTPAEVGNAMRQSQKVSNNNNPKKRRQQATLIINRNGQTIYVAPELLQAANDDANNKIKPAAQQYQYYQPSDAGSSLNENKRPVSGYPQPPLTIPLKRKGKPTQYITIPWSQLGISPPDQVLAVTEGLQSQPLILNIPQSAIQAMQNPRPSKRKPAITAEAVPLLADAALMDIFKPPRIPPARTPSNVKPTKKTPSSPVVIASKTKPGRQRVRPGTIVEKAPADDSMEEQNSDSMQDNSESSQFIVVGEDGEAGLSRRALPTLNNYLEYLQNGQFAYRGSRQLKVNNDAIESPQQSEQLIPVQIVADEEPTLEDKITEAVEEKEAKVVEAIEEPAMTKPEISLENKVAAVDSQ